MTYRGEIVGALNRVNNLLKGHNLYADLTIVGGSALILNGINSIETIDIDTCNTLSREVKEIFEDCSVDINDDAREYESNYEGLDFIEPDWLQFSNITTRYLDIGGVVVTKMKDTNPDKLNNLAYVLNEELGVDLTVDSISKWFEDQNVDYDTTDIENFLTEIDY